jgi:hypothetical protein
MTGKNHVTSRRLNFQEPERLSQRTEANLIFTPPNNHIIVTTPVACYPIMTLAIQLGNSLRKNSISHTRRPFVVTILSLMSVAALSTSTCHSTNNNPNSAECAAAPTMGIGAPEHLVLSDELKSFDLQSATMYPVHIGQQPVGGGALVTESESILSRDMIQKHMGEYGAVCFVVRRPGCVFCREEGLELTKLLSDPMVTEGFEFFGTIKETGVDDEGILEFSKSYPFPLYRDADLKFYEALGNRKLKLETWNPIRIVNGIFWMRGAMKRVADKKLEGNLLGEGFKKGGVIIFGKDGTQKYAYAEKTFEEFPAADILAAMQVLKTEGENKTN